MRIAIVGAGLAGLATAAAFSRAGHDISVFEQSDCLRADGLAINLWSNATSLLPSLGVSASRIPGEPFSRMVWRAAGREVTAMDLPARGLPHVNVERGDLLNALAAALPPDSITYGARCTDLVARPARRQWTWTVWQACVTAELPEVPAGAGVSVIRPGLFIGIWRLPRGRLTWFAEQPDRKPGDGKQLLQELRGDADPIIQAVARATSDREWIEWQARDAWPPRTLHRSNVVLAGDAAHAMLPTLGQGACQSIEDAAVLANAVAAADTLDEALRRYESARVPRLRRIITLTRAGAMGRRSNAASRALPAATVARLTALSGGPMLRRITRPAVAVTG